MTLAHPLSPVRCLLLLGISGGIVGIACGGDEPSAPGSTPGGDDAVEVTLAQESELFPSLDFSTGLLPEGSPVQASFSISAKGVTTVSAVAAPSGSKGSPTLTGLPGRGSVTIDGGFALVGQLVIDVSGLPSYDGPIPGIQNVEIPIQGSTEFDPFAIEQPIVARADIPAAKLPGIPLPGGIPGQLVLEIAEGSFAELNFTGICAGIDEERATYSGRLERAGTLVIKPSIEIEVPVLGTKSFDIPEFSVDLALPSSTLEMVGELDGLGSKPSKGEHVTGVCSAVVQGDAGAGGGATGGPTGTGGATGGGLACVEVSGAACDLDQTNCICVGCVDDGVCAVDDDCVCADCDGDSLCASHCTLDGNCDVYAEGCSCADCAAHPQCL